MSKLLQKEIPSAIWITHDKMPTTLFNTCLEVPLPLSANHENIMKKMIDWVKFSQDKKDNADKKLTEAIGIAAPQIGENIKMFYILIPVIDDKNDTKTYYEHALINPKIIGHSKEHAYLEKGEGCLSVLKQHEGIVPRWRKIVVTGYDYFLKKEVKITARDYEAIVFQHEQDHLEGKVYYHRINKKDPWYSQPDWIKI